MSLRTRIVLFNAVVLALAFLAAGAALASLARAIAPLRRAITAETRSVELADALRRELDREASTFSQAIARGDRDSSQAYRSSNARFDTLLDQAGHLASDDRARQALNAARAGEAAFNARAEEVLSQNLDRAEALRLLAESVLPARDSADVALDHFLDQQESAAREAEREASNAALVAVTTLITLLAGAGAAAAFSSLRLSRHLLTRLTLLGRATEAVAGGARDAYVPATRQGGDELDQLARAFNGMVRQLAAAEAAARQADELKSSFLASVSHDLRTPITTVKGLLETLQREDAEWDDASRREFLEVASRESERLARLVQNLLDLSRLEAGAWPLHPESVTLDTLVQSVVSDLSYAAGPLAGRDVEVIARTSRTAWADEDQLVRVLHNLLANAAKFSPAGTPITVAVEDAFAGALAQSDVALSESGRNGTAAHGGAEGGRQPSVVVHVTDEGPGVPDHDRAHVFDKFFRASATCSSTSGTGLGLAICRGIVTAHGGQIWVQPRPGGRGARFSFMLPAAAASNSQLNTPDIRSAETAASAPSQSGPAHASGPYALAGVTPA